MQAEDQGEQAELIRTIAEEGKGAPVIEESRRCPDGILEVLCKNGETFGYFSDDNILLQPWEVERTSLEEDAPKVKACGGDLPNSVTVMYDEFIRGAPTL